MGLGLVESFRDATLKSNFKPGMLGFLLELLELGIQGFSLRVERAGMVSGASDFVFGSCVRCTWLFSVATKQPP